MESPPKDKESIAAPASEANPSSSSPSSPSAWAIAASSDGPASTYGVATTDSNVVTADTNSSAAVGVDTAIGSRGLGTGDEHDAAVDDDDDSDDDDDDDEEEGDVVAGRTNGYDGNGAGDDTGEDEDASAASMSVARSATSLAGLEAPSEVEVDNVDVVAFADVPAPVSSVPGEWAEGVRDRGECHGGCRGVDDDGGGKGGIGCGSSEPEAPYRGWIFRLTRARCKKVGDGRGHGNDNKYEEQEEAAVEIWGGGCGEDAGKMAPFPLSPRRMLRRTKNSSERGSATRRTTEKETPPLSSTSSDPDDSSPSDPDETSRLLPSTSPLPGVVVGGEEGKEAEEDQAKKKLMEGQSSLQPSERMKPSPRSPAPSPKPTPFPQRPNRSSTPKVSWSYSSAGITDWSISSSIILSVAFRPLCHAVPEYTNLFAGADYLSRAMSCFQGGSPVPGGSTTSHTHSAKRRRKRNGGRKDSACRGGGTIDRCLGPPGVLIAKETYTSADVSRVDLLEGGIRIRAFRNVQCRAIRVHLEPKVRSPCRFGTDADTGPRSATDRVKRGVARVLERGRGAPNGEGKGDGGGANHCGAAESRGSCGVRGKSHSRYKESKECNLPPPPWALRGVDPEVVYGPIVTFAIPEARVAPKHSRQSSGRTFDDAAIEDCPPLLWKVEFPPDPSIAIESFTVFEGKLSVKKKERASTADDDLSATCSENEGTNTRDSDKREGDGAGRGDAERGGDGDSSCSSCSSDDSDDDDVVERPSHIYINGYQSWSFAGSIPKGEPQPSSAMPNVLSRAFNRGGTLPPNPNKRERRKNGSPRSIGVGRQEAWKATPQVSSTKSREETDGIECDTWHDKAAQESTGNESNNADDVEVELTRLEKRDSTENFHRGGRGRNEDYSDDSGSDSDESDDSYVRKAYYRSDFFCAVTSRGVSDADAVLTAGATKDSRRFVSVPVLDENGGPALVLGWLSQRRQFGLVTFDDRLSSCAMHASFGGGCTASLPRCDDRLEGEIAVGGGGSKSVPMTRRHSALGTDWAYAQILAPHCYDEEPLGHYLHSVASHNNARPMRRVPQLLTGWCSWYHYYENITAKSLKENFMALSGWKTVAGFNVALVDDGYMTAWGDWDSLKNRAFPGDTDEVMRSIAADIRMNGMKPGLWLAPFACDKRSRVAKMHPDWIIKNDLGRAANSSNCGKFFYGLDATNPDVREHAFRAVRRAVSWGFEVLKLDFLYAACLAGNGRYDMSMSRAEAMDFALRTLRDAAGPNTFIIGCGCPLGSAVGYIDGMRISADTGPTWYPTFPLPWWDNSTLPCLRAMIRNSISRSVLGHRWWHNDPDCILLGETTELSDVEVMSAATVVAMTGGMMLLSDDLTRLPSSRLAIMTKLFPVTGATAVPLDLHNSGATGMSGLLRLWCTDTWNRKPEPPSKLGLDDIAEISKSESDADEKENRSDGDNDDELAVLPMKSSSYSSQSRHSNRHSVAASVASSVATEPNAEASIIARLASFSPDDPPPAVSRRVRSCVRVAQGLGTWTTVSLSNWSDDPALAMVPVSALLPSDVERHDEEEKPERETADSAECAAAPNRLLPTSTDDDTLGETSTLNSTLHFQSDLGKGFHVFAFWSSKYISIPIGGMEEQRTLSKRLNPHESEIFHVKPVTPDRPQYIGSDMHFSCGYEVRSFRYTDERVDIELKNDWRRHGCVYVYIPGVEGDFTVTVNGEPGNADVVAKTSLQRVGNRVLHVGRILRIPVIVYAISSVYDGSISILF